MRPRHVRARAHCSYDSFAPPPAGAAAIMPLNTTKKPDMPDGAKGVKLTGNKTYT